MGQWSARAERDNHELLGAVAAWESCQCDGGTLSKCACAAVKLAGSAGGHGEQEFELR